MDKLPELEQRLLIESTKTGVARRFGWPVAILAAWVALLLWNSWFIAFVVLLFVYVFALTRYEHYLAKARRAVTKAEQAEALEHARNAMGGDDAALHAP